MRKIIIAIDGPAASGKSTAAKLLAKRIGYVYLDTGAMYRACALAAKRINANIDNPQTLVDLMDQISIRIEYSEDGNRTILCEEDVSLAIREPDISRLASAISAKKEVREKMVQLQRELGKDGGVILDGRDIGTVVFPRAELKFFLFAPVEERAKRRFLELQGKGINADYKEVLRELNERDKADSTRALAPLIPAEDAIKVDTGPLSIQGQVDLLYDYFQKKVAAL